MSDPRPPGRVTAADVARLVGVDRSTVSLVLGGKAAGRVAPAVQDAVRRAADELGYRPDAAARALRLGRADTLALVVPQATNPFFAPLLRGATAEARSAGHAVLLVDAEDDGEGAHARLFDALARRAVSGLVLWTVPPGADLARWRERVVLVEREAPGAGAVLARVEHGAREAARHLLALGHRRVGHLGGRSDHPTFARRREAARAVLREAGLDFAREERAAFDLDDAEAAGRALLAKDAPTAVLCDDDLLAAGLYRAARARGRRVPGDLSIVGFNDVDLARIVDPELTTVHADADRLGRAAVRRLLATLAGEGPATVRVDTRLVVRGSTGPSPGS